jgi:chemotaxis protein MotD
VSCVATAKLTHVASRHQPSAGRRSANAEGETGPFSALVDDATETEQPAGPARPDPLHPAAATGGTPQHIPDKPIAGPISSVPSGAAAEASGMSADARVLPVTKQLEAFAKSQTPSPADAAEVADSGKQPADAIVASPVTTAPVPSPMVLFPPAAAIESSTGPAVATSFTTLPQTASIAAAAAVGTQGAVIASGAAEAGVEAAITAKSTTPPPSVSSAAAAVAGIDTDIAAAGKGPVTRPAGVVAGNGATVRGFKPSIAGNRAITAGSVDDSGAIVTADDSVPAAGAVEGAEHTVSLGKDAARENAAIKPQAERVLVEAQIGASADKLAGGAIQLVSLQHPAAQATAAGSVAPGAPLPGTPASDPTMAVPIAALALEIAGRAQAGVSRFEIRLDPPELGRIEVRLDVDRDGQVTSRLIADRTETLDLLRRDAGEIERALQQAGLKTTDNALQFTLRDQSFSGGNQNAGSQAAAVRLLVPDPDLPAGEPAATGYGRSLLLGAGIDIRV